MQAIVLAAGNSASYHDFFDAGWEYLSQQLSAIGLQPVRGEAIPDSVSDCMSTLRDVIGQYQLVLVLASPQPRTATMLSAVLAKGLGLQLASSPAAAQAVQNHAQRLSVQLLPQDAAAFATIPDGASTLQNPNGFFQGYAISARRQLLLVLPTSPSELQHLYTTYLDELLQRFADSLRTPAAAKPAAVTAAATRTTATTAHLPGGAVFAPTASAAARPAPPRNRIISQCLGRLNGKTKSTERSSIDMARRTNLIQRLMAGKLTRNDIIRLGAVMVCLCVFAGCILYIASVGQESKDNKKLTDDLKTLFTTGTGTEADIPEKIREKYPKAYLPKFASLYEQNDEIAGWIKLDNSQVDYPVVQTSDNVYYDRLDFTRKSNQHGVPFVDFRTDQRTPSTNTIIYSHNMDDSQMFGELLNYKQLSYYQSHPVITYDSVYMEGKYKVFGIVLCKKDDPEFLYHDFIDKKNDTEMAEYVTKIRERSMINTKVDVRTDDYLLTLSTCDYAFKSNTGEHISRFVIFARKVRPGESAEVDVKGATINTNHIMPPEWYAKLEQQRAAELKKQEAAQAAQATQKWLYPEELNDLDAEGKKRVIADRKALVEKHLTAEEQSSMTLDDMLSAAYDRQELFTLYLSAEDQKIPSLSRRLSISRDNKMYAKEWLSNEEISDAGSWSQILVLIKERQSGSGKWLTADEKKALSTAEKNELIKERQHQATEAGVTAEEIKAAKTWEQIQALIAAKAGSAEVKQYIAANPQWLVAADGQSKTMTKAKLEELLLQRQAQATKAGINPDKYATWPEMKAAIDKAAGQSAKIEKLFADNKKWLDENDRGQSLDDLNALIAKRKDSAAKAKVNPADYQTWGEISAAIAKANQNGAIEKLFADNKKWLDENDRGQSLDDLNALIAKRKDSAAKAKVNPADYQTWGEISAAIAKANQNGAIEKLFADNKRWLDENDRGQSLNDLNALIAKRKDSAAKAKVNPADYQTWGEISAAIAKANQNGAIEKLFADNKKWLDENDRGQSLDDLNALIAKRKDSAAKAKVNPADYQTWGEISAAIEATKKPVEPPPVDPPKEPVDPPKEPVDPPKEPADPPKEPVDPPKVPVDPPKEPTPPAAP